MMKKVTIHEINGIRFIAVDNEAFDWGVEEKDFEDVRVVAKNDPEMKERFIGNIQKHFIDCFSEFIGRPVSLQELNTALESGWIE